jgi:hypothetical protein
MQFVETTIEDNKITETPTNKSECKSCQTKFESEKKAIHCRWCDGWEEDDDETSEGSNCCEATKGSDSDQSTSNATSFYCRKCTRRCWHCEVRGCLECVDVVCCDCCVRMCMDCANNDILCGCYGECYCCGRDINRGANGWPCNDCDKWYCDGCRYGDNDCQECNPRETSDEEATKDDETFEEESSYINDEEKVETSLGSDSCEAILDENAIMNTEDMDVAEPSVDSTLLLFA